MPIDITHFRNMAVGNQNSNRITARDDQGEAPELINAHRSFGGRLVKLLSFGRIGQTENRQTRTAFQESMRRKYGDAIADFAFPASQAQSAKPLSARNIQRALYMADLSTAPHSIMDPPTDLINHMEDYRTLIQSPVTHNEMIGYIKGGERMADAILNHERQLDGQELQPNLHTTLCLSWYMMARASAQGQDNLVHKGSLKMPDPEGRLHDFFARAPSSYRRVSTHFAESSLSEKASFLSVGFAGITGQPAQHGIEDFNNRFPGQKATFLFDKLASGPGAPQELFVKFESAGVPTVFRWQGSGDAHVDEGVKTKMGNIFRSMGRCLKHTTSFLRSRGNNAPDGPMVHQEHMHKGVMKQAVFDPFQEAVALLDLMPNRDDIIRDGKTYGLDWIKLMLSATLDNVETLTSEPQEYRERVENLLDTIRDQTDTMVDHGLTRRGNEVHISLS